MASFWQFLTCKLQFSGLSDPDWDIAENGEVDQIIGCCMQSVIVFALTRSKLTVSIQTQYPRESLRVEKQPGNTVH